MGRGFGGTRWESDEEGAGARGKTDGHGWSSNKFWQLMAVAVGKVRLL
jgi:hypothetical protein